MPAAVAAAAPAIAAAIDEIAERLAGAAGVSSTSAPAPPAGSPRVDAAECESTFSARARPGDRRSSPAARRARRSSRRPPRTTRPPASASSRRSASRPPTPSSAISASGRTPYVLGALAAASAAGRADGLPRLGPTTPSSRASPTTRSRSSSAPEILAGSTRLKAGTAQKLVLNMISTISMIRLGKTFGNLMVDVVRRRTRSCEARVRRIVDARDRRAARAGRRGARRRGRRREGRDRLAARRGSTPTAAKARLAAAGGAVRQALEPMRLGVEAALVDGELLPGRRRGRRRPDRGRRPRLARRPRDRRSRLRRPAGERVRRRRLPRGRRRRLRARRRRAARDRRHRLPADLDHLLRGATSSPPSREVPLKAKGPRILGVHSRARSSRRERLGTHPRRARARPRSRAARAAARGRPGAARHARARSFPARYDLIDAAPGARRGRLLRAHRRDRARRRTPPSTAASTR